MSNKLYEETDIQNIANAIRVKNGLTDTYKVSEMASAIENLEDKSIVEISTEEEMDALLISDNVEKTYRFIGTTNKYVYGDLYEVQTESNDYIFGHYVAVLEL